MLLNIDDIRERMKALPRGGMLRMSESTGVIPSSISDIKNGKAQNPTLKTLQRLSDYLLAQEGKA